MGQENTSEAIQYSPGAFEEIIGQARGVLQMIGVARDLAGVVATLEKRHGGREDYTALDAIGGWIGDEVYVRALDNSTWALSGLLERLEEAYRTVVSGIKKGTDLSGEVVDFGHAEERLPDVVTRIEWGDGADPVAGAIYHLSVPVPHSFEQWPEEYSARFEKLRDRTIGQLVHDHAPLEPACLSDGLKRALRHVFSAGVTAAIAAFGMEIDELELQHVHDQQSSRGAA